MFIMMTELDKKRFDSRILGKVIVSAEIQCGANSIESAAEAYITESSLYERICEYSILHGEDLQGLFKTDNYTYMSLFINNVEAFHAEFFGEDLLHELFNHNKRETVTYLISYPENMLKPSKEITERCF